MRDDNIMNIATQGGKIIVKDGKLAEDCGCCGESCELFPQFIRLSHDLPSSPPGGDFFDDSPRYCTQSIPSVLQFSRIDQRDAARVVQIECGYTGPITACSLPSAVFQTIAGINQIIVDLKNKRLFVWYEARIENTASGVTQASLLYATTNEVSLDSDTIATFQTQPTDGILGSSCVIGAGYTITVSKSDGPLESSYDRDADIALYKDTSGMWWPGREITVNVPTDFRSLAGDLVLFPTLFAGDYVLRVSTGFTCTPIWQLIIPLAPPYNVIYSWQIRANLISTTFPEQTKCGGCEHSFAVELGMPGVTSMAGYRGTCKSSWSGSMTTNLFIPSFTFSGFPIEYPSSVTVNV
jgi:hypothetical protein